MREARHLACPGRRDSSRSLGNGGQTACLPKQAASAGSLSSVAPKCMTPSNRAFSAMRPCFARARCNWTRWQNCCSDGGCDGFTASTWRRSDPVAMRQPPRFRSSRWQAHPSTQHRCQHANYRTRAKSPRRKRMKCSGRRFRTAPHNKPRSVTAYRIIPRSLCAMNSRIWMISAVAGSSWPIASTACRVLYFDR